MRASTTTRHILLCSLVVLLVGLAAGRVKAQVSGHIEISSYSFGIIQGQKVRISVSLHRLANPHLPQDPVNARIQLLDTDGEVIAESSELRVQPGQTRIWDQARNLLPASGEPGARLQLRARILVTTHSGDLDRMSLMPTIEVIDTLTGGTVFHMGKTFLIFVTTPTSTERN